MKNIKCFLACFDVLGFKVLRTNKTTEGLYQLYQRSLLPVMQHAAAGQGKTVDNKYVPDFNQNSLNYRIFSDTIILFTFDNSFVSFMNVINSAHQLLSMGFTGAKTPFRGAIGYGDLIYDGQGIFVGEALEDAYKWESKQVWSGCLLTDKFESFIKSKDYLKKFTEIHEQALITKPDHEKNIRINYERITNYDVPLYENSKTDKVRYYSENKYVLDWTVRVYENASSKSFLPHNNCEHVKLIIKNTADFENWARKNNRQKDT
ncbi:MAG: hypothetical protein KAV44_07970 [Bacteroidales bacterium]|jgi:hypothetical protein|nr:hypothetical protein [Bacteroidales bacterium]